MIFRKKPAPGSAEEMHSKLPLVRVAGVRRQFDGMLFICGLHRSGTTLVEELMHAHFRLAMLRAEVPENEGQHLQDVYPAAFAYGGSGRFAFAPEMHPDAPDEATAKRLRERLLDCWSSWVEGDGPWLVEKSPPNLTRIAWLRAVFPGARFLVVTRDPRAVAAATRKWSGSTPAELIHHWHVAYASAKRAMGPDCYHISYEALCDAPVPVIETAGQHLGLPERDLPLELPERFRSIENSNRRYLTSFPKLRHGPGIWSEFGYDLPA